MTASRSKVDCTHPRARHVHGTSVAYIRDKCGCDPCRAAATAHESARNRAQLYGRYAALVDAEPVRAHVRMLGQHGVGLNTISGRSGVGGGVICGLMYGRPRADGTRRPPTRRCTPKVRDRIMSVTVEDLAPSALVDATGMTRRLQALVCLGWSQSELARRLGMAPPNFAKVIHGARATAGTVRAVAALYDEMWDQRPPTGSGRQRSACDRAIRHAARQGWLPPLTWDDDSIDDPNHVPDAGDAGGIDEIAVERACLGDPPARLTATDRHVAITRLLGAGLNHRQIAERVGVSRACVEMDVRRFDLSAAVRGTAA